jgi:hypothetical protein
MANVPLEVSVGTLRDPAAGHFDMTFIVPIISVPAGQYDD